jgi:hypothetical protein
MNPMTRAKIIVLAVMLSGCCASAGAREVDPRAEVTIQVSPAECVLVHNRVVSPNAKVGSEAESDALARISKACDFSGLEARTTQAQAKHQAPDYSRSRTARRIARDALEAMVEYLMPTKDKPVPVDVDPALRRLRLEFREVLAGRDPYR